MICAALLGGGFDGFSHRCLSADPNPIVRQWATETNQKYPAAPNTTSAQQLKVSGHIEAIRCDLL